MTKTQKRLRRKLGNIAALKYRLSAAQQRKVCDRYKKQHESLAYLARSFGVDPRTIKGIIKRANLQSPREHYHAGKSKLTPEQQRKIFDRRDEGATKLAREFGVIPETIRRAITKLTYEQRKP